MADWRDHAAERNARTWDRLPEHVRQQILARRGAAGDEQVEVRVARTKHAIKYAFIGLVITAVLVEATGFLDFPLRLLHWLVGLGATLVIVTQRTSPVVSALIFAGSAAAVTMLGAAIGWVDFFVMGAAGSWALMLMLGGIMSAFAEGEFRRIHG
jgi:hypothetical protein